MRVSDYILFAFAAMVAVLSVGLLIANLIASRRKP
jgi:hypothetical protein